LSGEEGRADILVFVGILLIIFGFFAAFVGAVTSSGPFGQTANSPLVGLGIFLCLIGVPMVIIGFAMGGGKSGYSLGEEKKTEQSVYPSPSIVTKEKEIIVKEVVMIPCSYCGGLMPQTATFCPHCGARRKS